MNPALIRLGLLVALIVASVALERAGASESPPVKAKASTGSTAGVPPARGAQADAGATTEIQPPKITSVSPAVVPFEDGRKDIRVVVRGANFAGRTPPRVRYKPHPAGEGTCELGRLHHDDVEIECLIGRPLAKDFADEPLHFIVTVTGADGKVRMSDPSSDTLTPVKKAAVTELCWGAQSTGGDVQLRVRGRGFVVNKSDTPLVEVWTGRSEPVRCGNVTPFGTDDLVCYLPATAHKSGAAVTVRRPGEPSVQRPDAAPVPSDCADGGQ